MVYLQQDEQLVGDGNTSIQSPGIEENKIFPETKAPDECPHLCVICLESIGKHICCEGIACTYVRSSFTFFLTCKELQHRISGICDHCFHYDCLMQWMRKDHNDCPTCRQQLGDVESLPALVRGNGLRVEEYVVTMSPTPASDPSRGRRREQAGFPWARACRVLNVICFVVGVGYIVGSFVRRSHFD